MSYYTMKSVYETEIDALRSQIHSMGRTMADMNKEITVMQKTMEQHLTSYKVLKDAMELILKKTDLSCPVDRGEAITTVHEVNLLASEAMYNLEMMD